MRVLIVEKLFIKGKENKVVNMKKWDKNQVEVSISVRASRIILYFNSKGFQFSLFVLEAR